jgi:hypothetical protein
VSAKEGANQSLSLRHPPTLKLRRDGTSQVEDLAERMPRRSLSGEGGQYNVTVKNKINLSLSLNIIKARIS